MIEWRMALPHFTLTNYIITILTQIATLFSICFPSLKKEMVNFSASS